MVGVLCMYQVRTYTSTLQHSNTQHRIIGKVLLVPSERNPRRALDIYVDTFECWIWLDDGT